VHSVRLYTPAFNQSNLTYFHKKSFLNHQLLVFTVSLQHLFKGSICLPLLSDYEDDLIVKNDLVPIFTIILILTVSVKDAPFYDEFVEKQLLAGNIPSRYFTVSMVSVKVTIPPSDHAEMSLVVQPIGRSPDSVSSLQSIHESVSRN